jgi:hypothetical protein
VYLYNGKVRLAGNQLSEVPRSEVTAAEILILETIHGHGSFVDIERAREPGKDGFVGEPKLYTGDKHQLREHLAHTYAKLVGDPDNPIPRGLKVLADHGFANTLPDAVEDASALRHLADRLKASDADREATEAAAEARVRRRAAEAAALVAPTPAAPAAPATTTDPAELARLAGLKTAGEGAGNDVDFG